MTSDTNNYYYCHPATAVSTTASTHMLCRCWRERGIEFHYVYIPPDYSPLSPSSLISSCRPSWRVSYFPERSASSIPIRVGGRWEEKRTFTEEEVNTSSDT